MSSGAIKLFKSEATTEQVRTFVKEAKILNEKIKEKKQLFNEDVKSSDKIIELDDDIKRLQTERKEYIETSLAFEKIRGEINDLVEERKQLLNDASTDGIPKKEIDEAIKMLQKDIDPTVCTEVYKVIGDLVG